MFTKTTIVPGNNISMSTDWGDITTTVWLWRLHLTHWQLQLSCVHETSQLQCGCDVYIWHTDNYSCHVAMRRHNYSVVVTSTSDTLTTTVVMCPWDITTTVWLWHLHLTHWQLQLSCVHETSQLQCGCDIYTWHTDNYSCHVSMRRHNYSVVVTSTSDTLTTTVVMCPWDITTTVWLWHLHLTHWQLQLSCSHETSQLQCGCDIYTWHTDNYSCHVSMRRHNYSVVVTSTSDTQTTTVVM